MGAAFATSEPVTRLQGHFLLQWQAHQGRFEGHNFEATKATTWRPGGHYFKARGPRHQGHWCHNFKVMGDHNFEATGATISRQWGRSFKATNQKGRPSTSIYKAESSSLESGKQEPLLKSPMKRQLKIIFFMFLFIVM